MLKAKPGAKIKANRTVTLFLGNREEYEKLLIGDGSPHLKNIIQLADSQETIHLHKKGCDIKHRFTHHATYTRSCIEKNGFNNSIKITQWRCLDCDAVYTMQLLFIIRYKRLHTGALELMAEGMSIQNVSIRGIKHIMSLPFGLSAILGNIHWLGSIPLETLLLKFGLQPPEIIVEDEKFLKQNGVQTYAPLIVDPSTLVVWSIGYVASANEKNMEIYFIRYNKITDSKPIGSVTDGWKPSKKMLKKIFPGIRLGECHQLARMKIDRDCAKMKSSHGNWVDDEDETIDVKGFLKKMLHNVLSAGNEKEYDETLTALDEFTDLDPLIQSRWNSLARKKSEYLACRTEIGDWKTEDGVGKPEGTDRKPETGFGNGGAKPGKSKAVDEDSEIEGNKGDNPKDNGNASEAEAEAEEKRAESAAIVKSVKSAGSVESAETAGLKLPTTTVSIDQRIKFLDRKFQI